MVTRNVVLTEAQAALVVEQESDLDDMRTRLTAGAAEARAGARAPGSGVQAVRRAFARARCEV